MKTLTPSKILLMLANLIPLAGVFLFNWDAWAITAAKKHQWVF